MGVVTRLKPNTGELGSVKFLVDNSVSDGKDLEFNKLSSWEAADANMSMLVVELLEYVLSMGSAESWDESSSDIDRIFCKSSEDDSILTSVIPGDVSVADNTAVDDVAVDPRSALPLGGSAGGVVLVSKSWDVPPAPPPVPFFFSKFLFLSEFGLVWIREWRVSSSDLRNFLKHPG
ncbi:hypothetical protein PSN45_004199 [Yamadazyma tenuis]|uniref:uncharacterized protein n=1 Tax=Candida tenuis TaxID=2315449 RepID=UPI0027A3EFDC|nr:hypothetical protein PSN45_004199 [Yamadazyma tenuis]